MSARIADASAKVARTFYPLPRMTNIAGIPRLNLEFGADRSDFPGLP